MCHNLNLPIPNLANRNRIPKIPDTVIDLDFVMQEFLESGNVENLVRSGL